MQIELVIILFFLIASSLFDHFLTIVEFKVYDKIPTSLYYKKIERLQYEIEQLQNKKCNLKKHRSGYIDKLKQLDIQIKNKEEEIKHCKVHIKLEDGFNKNK